MGGCADNDFTLTVTAQHLRVILDDKICELILFLQVYRYLFAFLTKMTLIIANIFRVQCPPISEPVSCYKSSNIGLQNG